MNIAPFVASIYLRAGLAAARHRGLEFGRMWQVACVCLATAIPPSAFANDFSPTDLGNTAQVRGHAQYKNLPAANRNYYENGPASFSTDGAGGHDTNKNGIRDQGEQPLDRGDVAAFCVRYKRGADPLANAPDPPTTVDQFVAVMESLKTCVDDYLEPDKDPQPNSVRSDEKILGLINARLLRIGTPMNPQDFTDGGFKGRTGFVCLDHALFFGSLARELGFPARQVNVPLSKMQDGARKYFYQEAATEVWFNGAWHYFDAYMTKPADRAKALERTPDGFVGRGSITDRAVHFTAVGSIHYDAYDEDNGDPENEGWQKEEGANKNPAFDYLKVAQAISIEQQIPGVRVFVTALTSGLASGWTPDLVGNPIVPQSLIDLFIEPARTGARLDIPASAYVSQGVAIPDTADTETPGRVTVTNDTVVVNNPAADRYCINVWNYGSATSGFRVFTSTEGGIEFGFPPIIDGSGLAPGEVRQLFCASVRVSCDVSGDGKVDIDDINSIFVARNTPAAPGDPRDPDRDGRITVNDARICANRCTNARCVP